MNEIKRAAIYSPERDSYGIGLAMTFILDHGLTLSNLYLGKESIGKLADDAAKDYHQVIIVRNMDVLSKETKDLLTIERMSPIPFVGAEDLYYTNENLNIETMQYELLDVSKTFRRKPKPAEVERAAAESGNADSDAVEAVIQRRRDKKFWMGNIPFGFIKENGKIVADPATAPWVELIYMKALEGERISDIAADLDQEGASVPGSSTRWSENTIRDILKNDKYTQGIISKEMFNGVQAQFSQKAKDKPEPEERPRGLYQGMVFCGSCKRAMAYHGIGTSRRKTAIYSCKFHTGTNPRSEALDHMPKVTEEELKKVVLKQCNDYIHFMSDNKNLVAATERLKKKMDAFEPKIKSVGEKVIRNEIIRNADGLWNSWITARKKYYAAVAYLALMKHRFHFFHIGHMDEADLDTEKKLMDSITVMPDGKIKVNFKGDWIFQ